MAFCVYYFGHYIVHSFDDIHFELFENLESDSVELLNEIMFRGSAKSSIVATMYATWNIVYKKRRFIIIGSDTADSAQAQMDTVIHELSHNKRVIADFGRLYIEDKKRSEQDKKRKTVRDFITTNDIRVLLRARGQKVRGQRHGKIRPELAIVDDPETLDTAESPAMSKKMEKWVKNELIGGMSQTYMKVVVIGNWLNENCLVARLSRNPAWVTQKVPIILNEGTPEEKIAWSDRYVMTKKEARLINRAYKAEAGDEFDRDRCVISIEGLRQKHGTYVFRQEFMLEAISQDEQIVKDHWVRWIEPERLPPLDNLVIRMYVDPAVSEKDENDPTAWLVAGYDPETKRLYFIDATEGWYSFEDIKQRTFSYAEYYGGATWKPRIEAVTGFDYLCQQLDTEYNRIKTIRIRPKGKKRTRLMSASTQWEKGNVFVVKGDPTLKKLVEQTTKFGKMAHDDLCDVGMYAVQEAFLNKKRGKIHKKK